MGGFETKLDTLANLDTFSPYQSFSVVWYKSDDVTPGFKDK